MVSHFILPADDDFEQRSRGIYHQQNAMARNSPLADTASRARAAEFHGEVA